MNILAVLYLIGMLSVLIFGMAYIILIQIYTQAWKKQPEQVTTQNNHPFIYVIIPFRNEKDNIINLLQALQNQNYPTDCYEVIAVNDHSTDGTPEIIKEKFTSFSNFRLLHSLNEGKKAALKFGILDSKGGLIATTDADCIPGNNWLEAIASSFMPGKTAMLAGPVKMTGNNTFFSRFQAMEFMALQMCGAGAIFANQAVFCSGANLMFSKNYWLNVQDEIEGKNIASGDDVFLLHALKKQKKKIVFIKNKDAIVTTKTEKNFRDFLKQRVRWGGKSLNYKDGDTIFLAIVVALINLAFMITLPLLLSIILFDFISFFTWLSYLTSFSAFFFLKISNDYILLKEGAKFYDTKISIPEFLLFSFIYPFYLVVAAFGSLFFKSGWKGRVA